MKLEEIKKDLIIAIKKNNGSSLDDFFSPWLEYYYDNEAVFGAGGDFITSPDISPVFGLLLGLRIGVAKAESNKAEKEHNYHVVEIGGGRGTMMRDMLNHAPQNFYNNLAITMIERSAKLAATQQKNLSQYRAHITWQGSLATIATASVDFIIANEFFDCILPRQFIMKNKQWFERRVLIADNNKDNCFYIDDVAAKDMPMMDSLTHQPARENSIYEHHHGYGVALAEVARVLKPGGIITIIDYGNDGVYVGDNLQAIYRQQPIEPLSKLGQADISASVGFHEIETIGKGLHLKKIYFDNQKNFLQNLHGDKIAEKLISLGYNKEKMISGYQRLIKDDKPSDMGRLFKIMELQKT